MTDQTLKRIAAKEAADWQWWHDSPHIEKATVGECVHEADALIAKLVTAVEERDNFIALLKGMVEQMEDAGFEGFDLDDLRDRATREREEEKDE